MKHPLHELRLADRVVACLVIFGLGFIAGDRINAAQVAAMDVALESALVAVQHAHDQIDQLEGCTLRSAPPVALAAQDQGERHE
jgi:hypothetical protein